MGKPQVNVTLSAEEYDLLAALAFVEDRSHSELLRPAVTSYLQSEAATPEVQQALRALRARRAKQEKTLTDLRERIGGSKA